MSKAPKYLASIVGRSKKMLDRKCLQPSGMEKIADAVNKLTAEDKMYRSLSVLVEECERELRKRPIGRAREALEDLRKKAQFYLVFQ